MKRHKLGGQKSRRLFSKTASRSHRKNAMGSSMAMRGGIRL